MCYARISYVQPIHFLLHKRVELT